MEKKKKKKKKVCLSLSWSWCWYSSSSLSLTLSLLRIIVLYLSYECFIPISCRYSSKSKRTKKHEERDVEHPTDDTACPRSVSAIVLFSIALSETEDVSILIF
jgi:hypothetical protein